MFIDPIYNQLLLPLLVAIFLAINMGGSGTAPAFAAAYGAGVIRRGSIPGLFGFMVLLGALIAGKKVALTLGVGFLPETATNSVVISIIMFSIAISLLIANLSGIPQSTSQSTVLALTGAAAYYSSIPYRRLFVEIIPYWVIAPLLSFGIAYACGKYLFSPKRKNWVKQYEFSHINLNPGMKFFLILSSCGVAFSLGTNNVANASGPIVSMLVKELGIAVDGKDFVTVLMLCTLIIAPSFAIGSSIFGHKIIFKTGKQIVELGPISATFICFIIGGLLLVGSIWKGVPMSEVQLATGAVLAFGVAKHGSRKILSKKEVKQFFAIWVISPTVAFCLTYSLMFIADMLGQFPSVRG